jgi:DNA invertase Pin-like site-specific DNA recombinase
LVFHIFAALAEFERDLIKSRTRAGLEAARARGRKGGRPSLLNDQQKEKLQKLIKDSSLTPLELQKMFGVTRATLYRYAKNKPEVKHA